MPPIDSLIHSISTEQPSGADLSLSLEFDAIAELRREDDATLAQGEWVTELKVADWPGVGAACERLLRERTQDLRVAGWWTEAAAHTQGLRGLAQGLQLSAALLREQWDTLHPQPDDGDLEERVGALNWLLMRVGTLTQLAPLMALDRRKVALRDVEAARQRSRDGTPAPDGQPTLEAIQRGMAQAGNSAFDELLAAALATQDALGELQAQADARFGDDGPTFSAAHKALEAATAALRRMGRDSGLGEATTAPPTGAPGSSEGAPAASAAAVTAAAPGVLQSRAQALQQLRDVAAYFRRTEPHSPVAYLAEKAARWGDLPLHAWLRQVLKDEGALSRLDELLGLEPPQQ